MQNRTPEGTLASPGLSYVSMNQSPPKASASARPPAGASDAGRLITALAAGGSVLLLSATAVVVWPRTYGTEATLALDGGAKVDNPVALAGRIEAALLERDQLAGAAMDLPPELRSPDPIGRLRAGIRVQARGPLAYGVEFRGSDPQSVQRIANRLVDRAVALVPKLTVSPEDAAPVLELAQRTRAVTEFLAAHPQLTIEAPAGKPAAAGSDGALELLHTEKRQLEVKLATGATDNPYADPADDPALLARRLAELKGTIARREAALKQPRQAAPSVAPDVAAKWRTLLADLAAAQEKALTPSPKPVTARVTARAPLPQSPLTPNRLVLSIVAALLSMAAAMIAYVLPRRAEPRVKSAAPPAMRSEPPPAAKADPSQPPPPVPLSPSEPPPAMALPSTDAPFTPSPSDAPPRPFERTQALPAPVPRSDPPPPRPGSEPPGAIAGQRTVVVSAAGSDRPPAPANTYRRQTSPGGLEAPVLASDVIPPATGPVITVSGPTTHGPPAAPLFGSRPPPGAGSYSVSSSHPPPLSPGQRSSVERLSPLQSAHPPPAANNGTAARGPSATGDSPQIMSRPPALDPDAERWASRFETVPPPPEAQAAADASRAAEPRKRSGRWKTQVMGSMVPLEVAAAREGRPLSEPPPDAPRYAQPDPVPVAASAPVAAPPVAATLIHHDVPAGWQPNVDPADPNALPLRDGVLAHGLSRRLTLAVTGDSGPARARVSATLAFALASAGARVLLIEADFESPQIHNALAVNAPTGAGFSQQLMARRHDKRPRPWTVLRCSPNLAVLAEGRLRSPGQLISDDFARALRELAEQHHVVVLHAPALGYQAELRALHGLVQGVVLVRAGSASSMQLGDGALLPLLG